MDKAKRPVIRIGPLRHTRLPALKDERHTSAECGTDLAAMLKDALDG